MIGATGCASGVGDLAGALVVAPGRLHRERPGAERDVLRLAGAGGDPRALVGVLLALDVGPAAGRELVGDRLGVLVAEDHGETIGVAGGAGVDEVLPAGRPHVQLVGVV